CSPSDWRRIDSTVTINGKQGTMMAMPGAKDRAVITASRVIAWRPTPPVAVFSPAASVSGDRSCAAAATGRTRAAKMLVQQITIHWPELECGRKGGCRYPDRPPTLHKR